MKTLAVLIPNYNHGKYLRNCLTAILSQSRKPDEIIIVDDGSTDNSLQVLEEFRSNGIIKIFENGVNKGAVYSLNRALESTQCDYVVGTAADDVTLPGFFEKSMAALERWPEVGLCLSHPAYFIDKTEQIDHNANRFKPSNEVRTILPDELKGMLIPGKLWIAGHSSVVNRNKLLKAGGFIEPLKWHCDWFAYHVVALRDGICYIPEPLSAIRTGHFSYSLSAQSDPRSQGDVIWEMTRLLNSDQFSDVKFAFLESGLADYYPEYKAKMLESLVPWGRSAGTYLPFRSLFEGLSRAFRAEFYSFKIYFRSREHRKFAAWIVVKSCRALRNFFFLKKASKKLFEEGVHQEGPV